MVTKKTKAGVEEISVLEVSERDITFYIKGKTPLIYNAMPAKVWDDLLFPPPKKNAAERASTLKHYPIEEYRDSIYRGWNDGPTRLLMPSVNFKAAMCSVALDLPGMTKTQLKRLTYVKHDYVNVYGKPEMLMSIVRMANIQRTPDVRTRAILPKWAARVEITFTKPLLRDKTVANLLAAAGLMRGVGDWRQEKGSGSYGLFSLVSPDDPEFMEIMKEGREVQDAALETPDCYDAETERLWSWFQDELVARGFEEPS